MMRIAIITSASLVLVAALPALANQPLLPSAGRVSAPAAPAVAAAPVRRVAVNPTASCPVDRMDKTFGGLFPPNPYGRVPEASACIAREHDVIIVLGCPNEKDGRPSGCQAKRADIAVALSRAGYGNRFITTGASVSAPGVEGETLRALLVARGVVADRVFVDPKARHTDENLYYSTRIMEANDWTTALVVTEQPGHLFYVALCDSNCCVKKGRLTILSFPVRSGSRTVRHVVGHFVRTPPAPAVSNSECRVIKFKLMCVNLAKRRACAGNIKLRD